MDRLIVCGWDDDAEPLLEALRLHARLQLTAVGDQHPVSLVRARAATRLSCYQHLRQMVDSLDFEAALIGTPELAAELAISAAARGGDLLLRGDRMDAEALEAGATAAARHGVALAVLRPALRGAGYTFLTELVTADPRWIPAVLDVEVRDQRPAMGLLRDALAAATRLLATTPMSVVASAAGLDGAEPLALSAELRYADGSLVTLAGRSSVAPGMRLVAQTPAGTLELRSERGQSRLSITPWSGRTEESVLRDPIGIEADAERVARVRDGDAVDAQLAHREASILHAIEDAVVSGTAESVELAGTRSTLRVLAGGMRASSPRVGALHLV
jgi:hypothetical protein